MNTSSRLTIALCFLGPVAVVHAADFSYRATYTGDYTDNVRLASQDGFDEFTNNYGLGFDLSQEGEGLEATIDAFAFYQDFTKDTTEDRWRGTLDLTSVWHARPGSIDWYVRDVFRQVPIDDTVTDFPDNRQNSNFFSTGPDLIFRLSSVSTVRLEGRYKDSRFEDTDQDSQGYSAALRWLRGLSERSTSGINIEYSGTDYDDDTFAPDFDRLDVFWSGSFARGANSMEISLGATSIDPEIGEDNSGFLGSLLVTRTLSSESSLVIDVTSDYSDTGRASSGETGSGIFLDGDVFYRVDGVITYRRGTEGGQGFGVRVFGSDIDFETDGLDRKIAGAGFDFTRGLTARVSMTGRVTYTETDFDTIDRDDDDWVADLVFNFQLTRNVLLFAGGGWTERDSTIGVNNYDEGAARVGFTVRGGQ